MSKKLIDKINDLATPVKIMHVCGSHEHTIMENGIRSLLPEEVEIIAGPGCPVCVVPSREIDEALELIDKGVTITTFGDMLRVPGSERSLADAKAEGGDALKQPPLQLQRNCSQHLLKIFQYCPATD